MTTYVVVLRSTSAARFRPGDGHELRLSDVDGFTGDVTLRIQTRWVDEGFDAPVPRELWIEVRGTAASLDDAAARATVLGRLLAAVLAFCANTRVGIPDIHIAYDTTEGVEEREFLEVFVPDERGLPKEGRLIASQEYAAVLSAVLASKEAARITRALYQYDLALRYWYFGGEWLALTHLYMAVEALTRAALRRECMDRGIDEAQLARTYNIDPEDPKRPRWRQLLESSVREHVIFAGDKENYGAAKSASDGVEHGFMELSEVNRQAMNATGKTFLYVRRTITRLLELSPNDHPGFADRPPRDVQSFRKMVRGHFVGIGDDPAPTGGEYPLLKWHSSVKKLTWVGEQLAASFEEKLTVNCAAGFGFRGQRFEARGRRESDEPVEFVGKVDVVVAPDSASASGSDAMSLTTRANRFATTVGSAVGATGMPAVRSIIYGLFTEQIALFEAICVLLRDDRPVEAAVLLERLIVGTCRLQTISTDKAKADGHAIRFKLDAEQRQADSFQHNPELAESLRGSSSRLREAAERLGITIPSAPPDLTQTPFYQRHADSVRFVGEVALTDDLAIQFHRKVTEENTWEFRTRVVDAKMTGGIAGLGVAAMTASTVALADVVGASYDKAESATLDAAASSLIEDAPQGDSFS